MKQIISISFIALFFIGCSTSNKTVETPTKPFKSKVLAKIANTPTSTYTLPHIQESKYIKILILPFPNSEGDIDHGGILETKLEDSKFIFDDRLKKKIITQNNVIGTL